MFFFKVLGKLFLHLFAILSYFTFLGVYLTTLAVLRARSLHPMVVGEFDTEDRDVHRVKPPDHHHIVVALFQAIRQVLEGKERWVSYPQENQLVYKILIERV